MVPRLLRIILAPLLLLAAGAAFAAEPYPSRPIHWIVPYAPGGATDITARIMAQWLTARLGQSIVIENRSGAAGTIGTAGVAASAPDGYTLLFMPSSSTANEALYKNLPYNFRRDIAPVCGLMATPGLIEVNLKVPARTLPEFIAYARAHPGVPMGSPGTGTMVHLAAELLMSATGIKLTHVPYRGGAPALVDLLAGQVQVVFDVVPGSLPHVLAGEVRPLAVTSSKRWPALPDVPTVAETIPGFEANVWFGIGVARGTPKDIIARLEREVLEGLADPAVKAAIAQTGAAPMPLGSAAMAELIDAETDKWAKVIRAAGLKLE